MKPKDLKSPYKWNERVPLLKDGVFYVPNYYEKHDRGLFPSWEKIFGNSAPVHIEYCSGNGDWIIAQAQSHPEKNWVAVERKFERVRKIYSKRTNEQIDNLIIISGEALTFSKNYLQSQSVEGVYVNFPDPWPKDRHAKHRLIQDPFVDEVSRVVKKDGTLTLVSDSAPYIGQMESVMQSSMSWKKVSCPFEESYGNSYFEKLWRSLGRDIYFLHYDKT